MISNRDERGRFKKGIHSNPATEFKKGHKINLGKIVTEEQKQKQSAALIGRKYGVKGEKNHKWRGDDVKYRALHQYVRKYNPPPKICDNCREERKLDLANITGIYNREFVNWKYICRKCHIRLDRYGGVMDKVSDGRLGK